MKFEYGKYGNGVFTILPSITIFPKCSFRGNMIDFAWLLWYFRIEF